MKKCDCRVCQGTHRIIGPVLKGGYFEKLGIVAGSRCGCCPWAK